MSSYMAIARKDDYQNIDTDLVRHVIIDGIRTYNSKFRKEYGELVIAIDGGKSWRKEFFPYYKARREKNRQKSQFNVTEMFNTMRSVKEEIIEILPYKVIDIPHVEADDIIGELTRMSVANNEPVLVGSGDKDFIQLQIGNDLVKQYDKINDRYIGAEDPKRYLFDHVCKGDSGDDIPNIRNPHDCLVLGVRQKPMRQDTLDKYWEDPSELKDNERFLENLRLIDLRFTPDVYKKEIRNRYENTVPPDRKNLFNYLVAKKLKRSLENIGDF